MSSAVIYIFTPCCDQFDTITYSTPTTTPHWIEDYNKDPQAVNIGFINGTCYTITDQVVGLDEAAQYPPVPNTGSMLADVGDCDDAAQVQPECDCEDLPPTIDEGCGCPEGFVFNDQTGLCESAGLAEAEWTGAFIPVLTGCETESFGAYGLRLYEDISNFAFPITGNWDAGLQPPPQTSLFQASYYLEDAGSNPVEILTGYATAANPGNPSGIQQGAHRSSLWGNGWPNPSPCEIPSITSENRHGRLRNAGIWLDPFNTGLPVCSGSNYNDTTVTLDFCVEVSQTKQYLVGLGGDNTVRFYIDGVLAVEVDGTQSQTAPFAFWHVIPITLTAGQHTITLEGWNDSNSASFAGEIYDITLQDFQNTLLSPSDPGNPSYPNSATCGNVYEDLEPYIIFTTQTYRDLGQVPDINDPSGQWICNGEVIQDACGLQPPCDTLSTTEPLPCCYRIRNCDNPELILGISLDTTVDQIDLQLGFAYNFIGDPAVEGLGCFEVIDIYPCMGGEIEVTVEEELGEGCDACIPCYELTDCADPENTVIIQWDPEADPLPPGSAFVFDFAPDTCWSAELQFSPCEGTLYTPANIVETFIDCEECLKPCYKLIDCEDAYPTISTENPTFEVYVGSVIQWQDQLGETHCALVERYLCKDEDIPAEPIVVLDCFETCEECLPQPEPEPIFELSSRSVRPGYNTPGCPPEYYEKVKCKFSEAVYQEMIARRYGIETCCEIDKRRYEIKHEMLNLDALKDPYICNPICATYSYSIYLNDEDVAVFRYIDCDGEEQIFSPGTFVGQYEIEVCALTTFRPIVTITRADSSVEQYFLETDYHVCCPPEDTLCQSYVIDEAPQALSSATVVYRDCEGRLVSYTENIGEDGVCYQFCAQPDPVPAVTVNSVLSDDEYYTLEPLRDCDEENDVENCTGVGLLVPDYQDPTDIPDDIEIVFTYVNCAGQLITEVLTKDDFDCRDIKGKIFCGIIRCVDASEDSLALGDLTHNQGPEFKIRFNLGTGEGVQGFGPCTC